MTLLRRIPASGEWDVIVIGAGPAGAVAAHGLARAGFDTLLVDRQRFPRSKVCGGCVNRGALTILESSGLGHVVGPLAGVPLSGLRVTTNRGTSARLKLPGGIAVTRQSFDQALVDAARDRGVTFRGGVRARVIDDRGTDDRAFREVALRSDDGSEVVAAGRVVVVADGLGHPSLQGLSEFGSTTSRRLRIGLGAVVESIPGYERGAIHMAVDRAGYVGLVEVEGGRFDIAAAIDPRYLNDCGGPRSAIRGILERACMPVPQGVDHAAWHGTPPLNQQLRRPAGRRVLVIGDAAGYVEPFTGEGIAWALADAAAVCAFARRGVAAWGRHTEIDWVVARRRLVIRRQWVCRVVGAVLRSTLASECALRTLARFPRLAEDGVRRLHSVPSMIEEMKP